MELDKKDLHCISRLLQGAIYGGNGNVFDGCAFCKYNCKIENDPAPFYDETMKKLDLLSGVDLSPRKDEFMQSKFPYKKFLKNANDDIKLYFKSYFKNI